jgi:hypothetical protein
MRWKRLSLIALLMLVLLPQTGQALEFSVGSANVNVGNTFSINLNIANAGDLTSW